ncbi:MAG: tetratricopeptide repeat protein [Deltaproteobacteria bacterium]|jgi:tetratricopeptide (TPR) repeat protein|nr:tetratricopeptide repeat protein [Deltaproteobacteria bacterium]MBK8236031.1 tetratricopeptide repeat protein [Deltaproteobacteria bacterium]MBK8713654.1 tetratricopeptide repeat protein [Deltaproteobacteria bacterium]MBP7288873.1 tetratricopeptide repeat protein [Nannocystaceae bacterium]
MRRVAVLIALVIPMLSLSPGCKLASRQRVQAINRLNEGIALENRNNTSGAEKSLKEAIELDPSFAKPYYILGQMYRKQGKLVDAEKMFRGAIDNMKEEPVAEYPYQLGTVIASQGEAPGVSQADQAAKFNDAIAQFQECIKLDPNHYRAYYRTGTLYEKLDQPQKADQSYRKAIELRSGYSMSFVALGNMYIDYGHANVGQAVLELGTQVNDKDAHMWSGLGRAQYSLNKPTEAIESFKKAKAINPDLVDALYGLGMAYAEIRDRKNAVENLQAFLQKAGNDVPEDLKRAANDTMARVKDVI